MRRRWSVRRETVPRSDGQRRWDSAYQCLLRRATDRPMVLEGALASREPSAGRQQEANDAGGGLRPSLDPASAVGADD
jgi:hypothetical protein